MLRCPQPPADRPDRRWRHRCRLPDAHVGGRHGVQRLQGRRGEADRRRHPDPARRPRPPCLLRGAGPALRRERRGRPGHRLLRPDGRAGSAARRLRLLAARLADVVGRPRRRHADRRGGPPLARVGRRPGALEPLRDRLLHGRAAGLPGGHARPRPGRRHRPLRLADGAPSDRLAGACRRGRPDRVAGPRHLGRRRPGHHEGRRRRVRGCPPRRRRRAPLDHVSRTPRTRFFDRKAAEHAEASAAAWAETLAFIRARTA